MTRLINDVDVAVSLLANDQVVAIPTETVYGLAASIDSEFALRNVFELKNRPSCHPLIVHISSMSQLLDLAIEIPEYVYHLVNFYWPGPLTLVLKKSAKVNPLITGNQDTIAIRCPAHPKALEVIKKLGKPIAAPSANKYQQVSPTTVSHVFDSFANDNLTILEGERCNLGIESTIIDATNKDSFSVLRPGTLDISVLEKVTEKPCVQANSAIKVSGNMARHYQTQKPLYLVKDKHELATLCNNYDDNIALITVSEQFEHFYQRLENVEKLAQTPQIVAHELYYQLRMADNKNVKAIIIEDIFEADCWQGIKDRLNKAATTMVEVMA